MQPRALVLCVFALVVPGCGTCAGAPGQIVESRAEPSFVDETATLFVSTEKGIESIGLDGRGRRLVFATQERVGLSILDVSFDFRSFLLQSANTELFVGDVATGGLRAVPATAQRVSEARFSPDGRRFAATTHSDYDKPDSKEDDTVYIIDTATLAAAEIPPATQSWPGTLRWATDGSGVWIEMNWSAAPQWLTLADKTRHHGLAKAPVALDEAQRPPPASCKESVVSGRWWTTIRIVDGSAPDKGLSRTDDRDVGGRVIVELRGRKRGFHDYIADFDRLTWSPGCRFVVFDFRHAVWVADARGGAAAPIHEGGSVLFFAP